MLLNFLILILNFCYLIYTFDLSLLKINYFFEEKELYYITTMNNDDGDLYIEYWGEANDFRYFIGLNLASGEDIIFDNKNIKKIQASSNRIYHESIIINNNNENNIFSINYKYYEFINLNNGDFSQKTPDKLYDFTVKKTKSFRNSIIKLKNGNYLLNIILSYSIANINYLYRTSFKFNSYNMDNFKQIKTNYQKIDYQNSTNCFQTESTYIQCSYNRILATDDLLCVGIFDLSELEEKAFEEIEYINDNSFSKIFHIKDEIGAYVYFNKNDNNLPYIQIKKLNNDLSLENVFNFNSITLNANGEYTFRFNNGLFYSDGIKINDSKFVVMLTSENLLNLLICVFDIYNNDKSLRLRYYRLDLTQINIKISVNFRALKFGNFVGISFYNANTKYSGYTIFNFPNYKKNNNYFNNTINEIKLFVSNSLYLISFSEIELINNIFDDKIEKIKIIDFSEKYKSGVLLKSSITSSELSKSDILNINDQIVFEPTITGAIPGKYFLNFSLILKESNNENADYTLYYGSSSQTNYNPKTFNGNSFKLIYEIECHEKCKTCTQLGTDSCYYCAQCKDEYPYIINDCGKCENKCDNYIYINENKKYCIEKCKNEQYIYIESEDKKYCVEKCNNEQFIYESEDKKYCIDNCDSTKFIYIESEDKKYCIDNCDNTKFIYIESEDKKYCLEKCNNEQFIFESENKKYCIDNCDNTKFIYIENEENKFCIENCNNNQLIYIKNENEQYCLLSCFFNNEELFLDEEEKKCYKDCSENLNGKIYAYNNKCVSQYPESYITDLINIPSTEKEETAKTTIINDINHSSEILEKSNSGKFEDLNDNYNTSTSTTDNKENIESTIIDDINQSSEIIEENSYISTSENKENIETTIINDIIQSSEIIEDFNNNSEDLDNIDNIPTTENKETLKSTIINDINQSFKIIEDSINNNSEELKNQDSIPKTDNIKNIETTIIDDINQSSGIIEENSNSYIKNINTNDNDIDNIPVIIKNYIDKNSEQNFEIQQIDNNTILFCYSSNSDLDSLMNYNNKIIYIDLKECKDLIYKKYHLKNDSYLLILIKEYLNNTINSLINDFDYEIYTSKGQKINNLSICENISIEISSLISNLDLINYNEALILYDQGYDIYNISSNFYYDICLSAYINNSDLSIDIRQQEIYPNNISLCKDGCTYSKMNLESQVISCSCNIYLSDNNDNNENNTQYFTEETEQNFFKYIIEMINYKIIPCYNTIFDINNYSQNYGFFIESFLYFIIFICMLIYCCKGRDSIKLEYLHKEPNMKEIKQKEKQLVVKYNVYKLIKNKSIKNFKSSIEKKKNNIKIINQLNIYCNPMKRKRINKRKNIPVIKYKITDGNLNAKNSIDNSNSISSQKYMGFKNKFSNNNIINHIIKKKIENIDYNDLPYLEALEKDKRNAFQIFFSLFGLKIKIIQIIFFRTNFTHFSLTFSFYVFELILDITINSLLFSEDIISEKYLNNGKLLMITTNMLSMSSNIISYFILLFTEKLINQHLILNQATQEIKNVKQFYRIFIRLSTCIHIKIIIFYFILLSVGLFCTYYLFVFCAIYKQIQKNLFTNYIVSSCWSLGFTVFICLFVTITRKLSLNKKIKRLYIISKYIDDKF